MKLYELSKLSHRERFKYVFELMQSNSEVHPNIKIVNGIFDETIAWYQKPPKPDHDVISKLKDSKCTLPSSFDTIYEIQEKKVIKNLTRTERERIFNELKASWCFYLPQFKRISDLMENYKTNEMLVEYGRHSPPEFIHDKAIEVYKKCISFKVKLTKKVLSPLRDHPDQTDMWCYYVDYCIDENLVKSFLKDYQKWNLKIHDLWNEHYYKKQDFFFNAGYKVDWDFYIRNNHLLRDLADSIQKTQEKILSLLIEGKELVNKSDEIVSSEYEKNATEMSLYERELEISQINEGESAINEEYCYVYILECALFVFYVGIAADPNQRFEQHIRGAFSDESHLFKSKFIQKYHSEVKQSIVYEGTRRECKSFERNYIAKYKPLGNMTDGGEG